jgi:Zn-dependent M28 family amino/carboxypeptidase
MERTRDGSGYGRAVPPRSQGAIHAAKLGAVAVVIRSVGTDENRAPHTGAMRYDEKVPKIPAAALAIPDADTLHRLLAQKRRVRLKLQLGARTLPDADGANVIGEVEGSAAPQEIVLLGAHLDSWDLGRGAIDDGAGCAIVIEAARQIAKLPRHPRRTVRVVLFANEENGLRGARGYAAAHPAELGAHVIAMEADLGAGRVYEARFLGAPAAAPAFRAVAAGAEPLGVHISGEDAHGGADILPLMEAGVPVIDLRQDATAYFDFHHTANDTLERVHKDEIDQAAAAFAAVAFAAADAPTDFGRLPEDKRKRD